MGNESHTPDKNSIIVCSYDVTWSRSHRKSSGTNQRNQGHLKTKMRAALLQAGKSHGEESENVL